MIRGNTLYAAWLGDSQSVLVRNGYPIKIVEPHKPNRPVSRIVANTSSDVCLCMYVLMLGLLAVSCELGHLISYFKNLSCAFQDEKKRIEELGGTVIHWGTWRVNGQLAVSRAIGE